MKHTTEQLNKIYQGLPEDLKDIIASVDSTTIIQDVGGKYNLHIDQIGELGSETGLVLMGITPPAQFVTNLASRMKVDRLIANEIANEINEKIFSRVRESLKKAQTLNVEPEKTATEEVSGIPDTDTTERMKQDTLKAIEKPESIPVKTRFPESSVQQKSFEKLDIIKERLSSPVIIPKSETTVAKPTEEPRSITHIPPQKQKQVDPYREII